MLRTTFKIVQAVFAVIGLAAVVFFVLKVEVITWSQGEALWLEREREAHTYKLTLTPTERWAAIKWRHQDFERKARESSEDAPELWGADKLVLILGDGD